MRGIRRALLATGMLALLPGRSFADDPYADYRIPEHYWRSWTANLQGSGSRNVSNSFDETTAGTLTGSGYTSLYGGYDSDTRSSLYNLYLQANGDREHSSVRYEILPVVTDRDDGQQHASQSLSGAYAWSRYPWAAPLGYALSTSAIGVMNQSWNSTGEVQSQPPVEYHSSSNVTTGEATGTVSLTASVSWGRVRDATPVYQVQVLEQRLLDMGTITRPLSTHAREQLASLYTVQSDVSFAHQRPTKYFWRELERLLTEDGVLGPAGLDAYAVQRLVEPISVGNKGLISRARGFAVGPQVMLSKSWTHNSGESANRSAVFFNDTLFNSSEFVVPRTRTDEHSESILSGAFVDYHHPFGMRWQVDGTSQGLLSESGATLSANSTLRATWQVADRWFITGGLHHVLTAPGHGLDRRVNQWRINGDASVNYFFEDAWAFQLGYTHQQMKTPSAYSRQDGYTLGVTFQFAGWLYAPGLFAPMRLSPPAN